MVVAVAVVVLLQLKQAVANDWQQLLSLLKLFQENHFFLALAPDPAKDKQKEFASTTLCSVRSVLRCSRA